MPKVTEVSRQKKNSKRFNVFLDGQFAFGADEDLVVSFRLIPGKVIDSLDLEKILFEAEVGKLMDRIYGLLGRRGRSEKEIRDYLRQLSFKRKIKGGEEISDLIIGKVIEKLVEKRLINDYQFAYDWVESRGKSRGKNILKAELYKKGIDREVIDQVLDELEDPKKEEILVESLINKKISSWKNLNDLEFKKKAFSYLGRRGFSFDLISETIEKYLKKR